MNFLKKTTILLLCISVLGSFAACGTPVGNIRSQTLKSRPSSSDLDKKIYGEWATEKGTLLVIHEDGTCGWYKSKDDRADNYYSGKKVTVLRGDDALQELGISKEEQNRVEFYKDSSAVYSVRLYYDYLKSGGVEKPDKVKGGYQWLMFKITDTDNYDEAIAYDMGENANSQAYELTKLK